MKFLYLCADRGIPILGAKGASVHAREFIGALMGRGHSVTLVCAKRGQGNAAGSLAIIEITPHQNAATESYVQIPGVDMPSFTASENLTPEANQLLKAEVGKLAYNAQLQPALERIIADVQPDVLYERYVLFAYAGSSVARQNHLPYILEVNAPLIQERQASNGMILTDLAQRVEDQVFSRADILITVSAALKEYAIARGVDPDHAKVIANGVNLDRFNPTVADENQRAGNLNVLGLPADLLEKTIIGFVGSLKPWHGVDILVEVFARARRTDPRLFLLIVGEGPQLEPLRLEVQRQGLSDHVHFSGAVPHHLVPRYMALMDIAVAPHRHQALFYFSPLKILEYMAMGKPVIATRQGQISDLIDAERNGLLCEAEDVDALTEALVRLARDPDLRDRLGMNAAAAVAEQHSWLHVADQVTRLVIPLVKKAAPRSPSSRVVQASSLRSTP